MSAARVRKWMVVVAMLAVAPLAACSTSLDSIRDIPDTASFLSPAEAVLNSGQSVRVVVFGSESLSGTYRIDDVGRLKLGALGSVAASGLTLSELENRIAALLASKGIANAQVSVMAD